MDTGKLPLKETPQEQEEREEKMIYDGIIKDSDNYNIRIAQENNMWVANGKENITHYLNNFMDIKKVFVKMLLT